MFSAPGPTVPKTTPASVYTHMARNLETLYSDTVAQLGQSLNRCVFKNFGHTLA